MILALISVLVIVTAGFFIWKNVIPETWKVAGMFEGIYTGGTPNFVALKMALEVDPNLFVIVSTYDMIVGAFLVLFFITVAPRIFRFILPPFRRIKGNKWSMRKKLPARQKTLKIFQGCLKREFSFLCLKHLVLSLLIFAFSGGLALLLPKIPQMVVVILSITTLGFLHHLLKSDKPD